MNGRQKYNITKGRATKHERTKYSAIYIKERKK